MWRYMIVWITGFAVGVLVYRFRRSATKPPLPDLCNLAGLSETAAVDTLKAFSETQRSLHAGRSERDFTIVTTTLAFYGATVALKYTSSQFPKDIGGWLALAFVALAGVVTLNVAASAEASDKNQAAAEWAEDTLAKRLTKTISGFPTPRGHPNWSRWLWFLTAVWSGAGLGACPSNAEIGGFCDRNARFS